MCNVIVYQRDVCGAYVAGPFDLRRAGRNAFDDVAKRTLDNSALGVRKSGCTAVL